MPTNNIVKIFDTTLRDGEQSPGFSMNLKEKIKMAKQLEKLGTDIIEAGFAIASKGDFESVKAISSAVTKPIVASLARTSPKDIKRAYEAVKDANHPRLHIFLATSDIHMKDKLKMTRAEVLKTATQMTKYARSLVDDVEFSAEDSTRSDMKFLAKVIEAVIKEGATTINLPDTVGFATPEETYKFFTEIQKLAPSLKKVTISAHCHNDLGLGVANSLSAIRAGVRQVETTINGIGERAGNASMEEIVMSLKVRHDLYGLETNINSKELVPSSKMLSAITGIKVPPNKAIVGENAFAHESGIHQHGMLANKLTYEIMTPESVGALETNLVLGKHSGKHAFKDRLTKLNIEITGEELETAFEKFKDLADKKKKVYDSDLFAIAAKESVQVPKVYSLDSFVINTGNNIDSVATVILVKDNKKKKAVSGGDGPINASYKAIDKIAGTKIELVSFKLDSVTEDKDALGDCHVVIKNKEGKLFTGRGLSTDIIEASIFAYINAVNKMLF